VWAVGVVDGKKFHVACVHLSATWKASLSHANEQANRRHSELRNLRAAWDALGRPPIVVGGDFNQLPVGNNYFVMTERWTDALASLGKTGNTFKSGLLRTRIDYLLVSPGWAVRDGAVVVSDASDHRPVWVEVSGRKTSAGPTP
jgi:endonuclease/exonuclease/phosphatase family metal-dependent hydrolase